MTSTDTQQTPLATNDIAAFYRVFQRAKRVVPTDDEHAVELAQVIGEAEKVIDKHCRVDLAYLTASGKQVKMAEDFWSDRYRLIAAVGANRSGKSFWAGVMCVCRWIREKSVEGSMVWCISQTSKKSIALVQRLLWENLDKGAFSRKWNSEVGFGMRGIVTYKVPESRGGGACTITFYNEKQELYLFESDEIDLAWWDEASREAILSRIRSRILDRKGKILISTIPQEIWLHFRIEEGGNPDWSFMRFSTYDNEANLPPGEIDKFAADLTPEERKLRVHGEFVRLQGLIFPEFGPMLYPDGHVLDTGVMKSRMAPDWPTWVYIDVGIHTAVGLYTVDPKGRCFAWDEVCFTNKRPPEVCEAIREMLKRNRLTVDKVADGGGFFMDPFAWNRSPLSEAVLADLYQDEGIPVRKWSTKKNVVGEKAWIARARTVMGNDNFYVLDRCENHNRQLRSWRWAMDDDGKIDLKEKPEDSDNHCCDTVMAWLWEQPVYDQPGYDSLDQDTDPDAAFNTDLDQRLAGMLDEIDEFN